MSAPAEDFEGWAILEIMGHRQVAGFVRDVVLFGNRMARVDVPEVPATTRKDWQWDEEKRRDVAVEVPVPAIPGFTHYYGGSAIFSCVPTTEELARAAAALYVAGGLIVVLNTLVQAFEQGWRANVVTFAKELGLENHHGPLVYLAIIGTGLLVWILWPVYLHVTQHEEEDQW